MGVEFAAKKFLLYLLLVMCSQANGGSAQEMTGNLWEDKRNVAHQSEPVMVHSNKEMLTSEHPMDNSLPAVALSSIDGDDKSQIRIHPKSTKAKDDNDNLHRAHANNNPASHMEHKHLPELTVFFILDDLRVGNKMPIYFPKRDPSQSPQLLPKEEANEIPFSYNDLPHLLKFFSFSQGSPQAKAMEDTLRQCELKPIKGETKTCATSMESMLDFVRDMLGWDSQFKVVSTTHLTKSSVLLQNYTILQKPEEIPAPKMVACHTMPYPYAVFYCHRQRSENKVFVVSLSAENGGRVEAVAVCHLDTSNWNRNHLAFQVLGIEPGSSPVCHFFPQDHLVYVPMPITTHNGAFVM